MSKFSATHNQAATTASELNSLANAGIVLSTQVIDNTVNLDPWGAIQGSITFNAAPAISDNNTIDLYAVPSWDGTNYEAVDAANLPPTALYLGSLSVKSVSTTQVMSSAPFPMPGPIKFKLGIKNNTGTALAASAGSLTAYSWQTQ